MPEFFSRWVWASFLWNLFCLKTLCKLLCKKWFMKLFCERNVAAHKKWSAVVVLEIHRKLTCGSSVCNVGAFLKLLTKENLLQWFFSLTCNVVKMEVYYSNDFQKVFLARNPACDCNQIRSNQIAASVNALNYFSFLINCKDIGDQISKIMTKTPASTLLWHLKVVSLT